MENPSAIPTVENLDVKSVLAILNDPANHLSEKKTRICGTVPKAKEEEYTINAGMMSGRPYFEIMDTKRIICGCAFKEATDLTFTNTFLRVVEKLNKLP